MTTPRKSLPRVYIIGGGFAGLMAAKALAKSNVHVTLIDRRNHHTFQPLLYQVATAALSPASISAPLRRVLHAQANCDVVLAEVKSIDAPNKQLLLDSGRVPFDYLLIAAGASHSYFGHDEWAAVAPGLKNLEDATELRRRMLLAFEAAEFEADPQTRAALLTFAIIGAGPTGVELAGAIKEIATQPLAKDFRHIDTKQARVILLEGLDRVLPPFPPKCSEKAKQALEEIGVEIRLNAKVTNITADGVHVGDEFIPAKTVFWGAGVKGSPLGESLGVPLDKNGRVIVEPNLSVPNHPDIFVAGDMAAMKSAKNNQPVPGVAQGAIQSGQHVGNLIAARVAGWQPEPGPFSYWDKGTMAVIGRRKAVARIGKLQFGGFIAWLLWATIHIAFLVGFRNRVSVLLSWFWSWIRNARDARLILGDAHLRIRDLPGEIPSPAAALAEASAVHH